MWDMIQQRDLARLLPLIEELTSPAAAAVSFCKYAATWRKVTRPGDHKDETVSPFGESLLHAAAFAGSAMGLTASGSGSVPFRTTRRSTSPRLDGFSALGCRR